MNDIQKAGRIFARKAIQESIRRDRDELLIRFLADTLLKLDDALVDRVVVDETLFVTRGRW